MGKKKVTEGMFFELSILRPHAFQLQLFEQRESCWRTEERERESLEVHQDLGVELRKGTPNICRPTPSKKYIKKIEKVGCNM